VRRAVLLSSPVFRVFFGSVTSAGAASKVAHTDLLVDVVDLIQTIY
jgi:hypothetical protein